LARRIGERIRALRVEAELSFDAFVEETGLGRGYISELERGLVVPTVGALAKVAAVLDVTLADLVLGHSLREQIFEATLHASPAELERLLRALPAPAKAAAPTRDTLLRTAEPKAPRLPRRGSKSGDE
jgi:transcriptional regulator with XRE-family HTH domain